MGIKEKGKDVVKLELRELNCTLCRFLVLQWCTNSSSLPCIKMGLTPSRIGLNVHHKKPSDGSRNPCAFFKYLSHFCVKKIETLVQPIVWCNQEFVGQCPPLYAPLYLSPREVIITARHSSSDTVITSSFI